MAHRARVAKIKRQMRVNLESGPDTTPENWWERPKGRSLIYSCGFECGTVDDFFKLDNATREDEWPEVILA